MRRNVLVVALGLAFLLLLTWLGSVVVDIVPHRVTAQVQTASAGPYQITLHVNSNPPLITQPTSLSVQILTSSSQQPVTNAHVTLENTMETIGMGTVSSAASAQNDGSYMAHVQFTMSGPWQVNVIIAVPGQSAVSATFEVSAQ